MGSWYGDAWDAVSGAASGAWGAVTGVYNNVLEKQPEFANFVAAGGPIMAVGVVFPPASIVTLPLGLVVGGVSAWVTHELKDSVESPDLWTLGKAAGKTFNVPIIKDIAAKDQLAEQTLKQLHRFVGDAKFWVKGEDGQYVQDHHTQYVDAEGNPITAGSDYTGPAYVKGASGKPELARNVERGYQYGGGILNREDYIEKLSGMVRTFGALDYNTLMMQHENIGSLALTTLHVAKQSAEAILSLDPTVHTDPTGQTGPKPLTEADAEKLLHTELQIIYSNEGLGSVSSYERTLIYGMNVDEIMKTYNLSKTGAYAIKMDVLLDYVHVEDEGGGGLFSIFGKKNSKSFVDIYAQVADAATNPEALFKVYDETINTTWLEQRLYRTISQFLLDIFKPVLPFLGLEDLAPEYGAEGIQNARDAHGSAPHASAEGIIGDNLAVDRDVIAAMNNFTEGGMIKIKLLNARLEHVLDGTGMPALNFSTLPEGWGDKRLDELLSPNMMMTVLQQAFTCGETIDALRAFLTANANHPLVRAMLAKMIADNSAVGTVISMLINSGAGEEAEKAELIAQLIKPLTHTEQESIDKFLKQAGSKATPPAPEQMPLDTPGTAQEGALIRPTASAVAPTASVQEKPWWQDWSWEKLGNLVGWTTAPEVMPEVEAAESLIGRR
jgi:hypothetical protein